MSQDQEVGDIKLGLTAKRESTEAVEMKAKPTLDQLFADREQEASAGVAAAERSLREAESIIEAKKRIGVEPTEKESADLESARPRAFIEKEYLRDFVSPLRELVDAELETESGEKFRLREVIEPLLDELQSEDAKDPARRVELQKRLVALLIKKLSSIPPATWETSPRATLETKKGNCAANAATLTELLGSVSAVSGIKKVEYVNPLGHAMNVVTLEDDSVWYADPRNDRLVDISANHEKIRADNGVTAYRLIRPTKTTVFHVLPSLGSSKDAMVKSVSGNLAMVPDVARGVFADEGQAAAPEAQRQKMQAGAIAARDRLGLTDERAAEYRAAAKELSGPMESFKDGPVFQAEVKRWKTEAEGSQSLREVAHTFMPDEADPPEARAAKLSFRKVLAGNTDVLGAFLLDRGIAKLDLPAAPPDLLAVFEGGLNRYREALHMQKEIVHRSDKDFADEIAEMVATVKAMQ